MQAIFKNIVDGDAESVRARIQKDPSLVSAVAAGAPKKFAGQSALQVAICSGQFPIARHLLEAGADPNFADTGSPSGWAKSVLHDAAVAAVMRSRWSRRTFNADSEVEWKTVEIEKHDEGYEMLVALIEAGADVTAEDSKGATPLSFAARAAHDVLPRRHDEKPELSDGQPLTAEVVHDLNRVFSLLKEHGAEPAAVDTQLGMSLADYYRYELVGKFLAGTVEPDST